MHPYDTGPEGIALIKKFEGFRKAPYKCPAGIWTIGYGSTKGADTKPIHINTPDISEKDAEALLVRDVKGAERAVRKYVSVPLCSFQFDALISFVYNLGEGNFRDSTLLRELNVSNIEGAASEFDRWVFAGGQRMAGLVKRRAAEAALFMHELPGSSA